MGTAAAAPVRLSIRRGDESVVEGLGLRWGRTAEGGPTVADVPLVPGAAALFRHVLAGRRP